MKMLLYCTKSKPYLVKGIAKPMHTLDTTNPFNFNWKLVNKGFSNDRLNGKIVAECDFEVEEIYKLFGSYGGTKTYYKLLEKRSCLSNLELDNYLDGKKGYAIHIKNLNMFDKPRELDCYFLEGKQVPFGEGLTLAVAKPLKRPPQSMFYVRGCNTGEKYVLISIRPNWILKILKGEKTIEIRKRVLKEMLNKL